MRTGRSALRSRNLPMAGASPAGRLPSAAWAIYSMAGTRTDTSIWSASDERGKRRACGQAAAVRAVRGRRSLPAGGRPAARAIGPRAAHLRSRSFRAAPQSAGAHGAPAALPDEQPGSPHLHRNPRYRLRQQVLPAPAGLARPLRARDPDPADRRRDSRGAGRLPRARCKPLRAAPGGAVLAGGDRDRRRVRGARDALPLLRNLGRVVSGGLADYARPVEAPADIIAAPPRKRTDHTTTRSRGMKMNKSLLLAAVAAVALAACGQETP